MVDGAAWHDFYVMAGGAAAALTGLVVVALSLHAKAIMAHPLYRDRAFAAILALMTQVFLSAAVLVPGQPPAALGIEIGVAALFWFGRSLWAIPYIRNNSRRLRGHAYEYRRSTAQWIAEWSVWIAWVIAPGSEQPSGSIVIVGETQEEAEANAREWLRSIYR